MKYPVGTLMKKPAATGRVIGYSKRVGKYRILWTFKDSRKGKENLWSEHGIDRQHSRGEVEFPQKLKIDEGLFEL